MHFLCSASTGRPTTDRAGGRAGPLSFFLSDADGMLLLLLLAPLLLLLESGHLDLDLELKGCRHAHKDCLRWNIFLIIKVAQHHQCHHQCQVPTGMQTK